MQIRKMLLPSALALAVPLAACGDAGTATLAEAPAVAPVHAAAANGVEGEYIVVLKEGANPTAVAAIAGVTPRHVYTAALTGFAGPLTRGQVTALQHHPAVDYLEQNQVMEAQWVQSPAPWGLDRIDQRHLPLNNSFVGYTTTAAGVNAYILDTGIRRAHSEFGGRAVNVFDAFGGTARTVTATARASPASSAERPTAWRRQCGSGVCAC